MTQAGHQVPSSIGGAGRIVWSIFVLKRLEIDGDNERPLSPAELTPNRFLIVLVGTTMHISWVCPSKPVTVTVTKQANHYLRTRPTRPAIEPSSSTDGPWQQDRPNTYPKS